MIHISHLTFTYPGTAVRVLNDLSLDIEAHSCFGLLGPNGAGKTTLINLLCGLLPSSVGSIHINGVDVATHAHETRASLAVVPQHFAFYPTLSAAENLRFFARVQGLSRAHSERQIERALRVTELWSVQDQRAADYSGGMKRRLNIAIALLNSPRILLLDEPTVGIDPQSRSFILDFIRSLRSSTTIIYSSHYMEEVESLCDQLAIMDHGRVLASGALSTVLQQHGHACLHLQLSCELHIEKCKSLYPDAYQVGNTLRIPVSHCENAQQLIAQLKQVGIQINRFSYDEGNLEDVFLKLTQRTLRDR